MPAGEQRVFARGDRIFEEGDPSDFFFIVATGRVKVFKGQRALARVAVHPVGSSRYGAALIAASKMASGAE